MEHSPCLLDASRNGKIGDMLGPQAIVSNIKNAMHSERSIVNVLYSKADVATISRFVRAVDRIALQAAECVELLHHSIASSKMV